MEKARIKLPRIERLEVIDHTAGAITAYPGSVRVILGKDVDVELSLQDDGRTLKVFLSTDPL